jgi:hypothetical protein
MKALHSHWAIGTVLACLAAPTGALAQYDRDGRYVPSPMGVPSDPYARPIPNYSGRPGDAIGTPIWPRGNIPAPPDVPPLKPAETQRVYPSSTPRIVTPEVCDKGWSKATRLTPVEFRRLCARVRRP